MLSIFSPYAFWPSVYLIWRNICLVLLPYFGLGYLIFLVPNCMSCLYILDINCSSIAWFAGIFSYSKDCFSVLFFISFSMQKLLSLIRFLLFTVVFSFITQEMDQKIFCCNLCQRMFCLYLLLKLLHYPALYLGL